MIENAYWQFPPELVAYFEAVLTREIRKGVEHYCRSLSIDFSFYDETGRTHIDEISIIARIDDEECTVVVRKRLDEILREIDDDAGDAATVAFSKIEATIAELRGRDGTDSEIDKLKHDLTCLREINADLLEENEMLRAAAGPPT